jgi:hypothetical protein
MFWILRRIALIEDRLIRSEAQVFETITWLAHCANQHQI